MFDGTGRTKNSSASWIPKKRIRAKYPAVHVYGLTPTGPGRKTVTFFWIERGRGQSLEGRGRSRRAAAWRARTRSPAEPRRLTAFGDLSLKMPGSLPSILWIPISTYPSTDSGHYIPIPGTAVWPFSSTLGILQDYDRDQMLVLAHLFTSSRPVRPRHCTSAQSLPHDGPPHSRQEVGTDPKTEIPFSGIPVRPGFLPSHSNSGSISQNQALICSFLLNQGGCAHTWQILLGLFASTEKMVPLGLLHICEAQHCISQHWDFNVLTRNLWIPLSPTAEEDFQWRKSAHNVLRGAPVTPTNQTLSCSRMHRTSGLGADWNALTVSGVWTTTEKTLHSNLLELEAIHRAMLHWLRKLMGLTVLVASEKSTVVFYINKQG